MGKEWDGICKRIGEGAPTEGELVRNGSHLLEIQIAHQYLPRAVVGGFLWLCQPLGRKRL